MKSKFVILLILVFSVKISSQTYDINSFLELVKKNNKDIQIALKDLDIAETQDAQARSNAYPQISAKAGYNRNLKDAYLFVDFGSLMGESTGAPQKFKINYKNEFSAQAVISQQVFNFSVFNAIKAAEQYQKLTDYIFDATLQGIINGSKKAFYQTLLLKKVLDVNNEASKNAEENYSNMKKKFDSGLASEFELLQAEVRYQNYLPLVSQSERNYNLALNSLKLLAGLKPQENFEIAGELEKIDEKPQMMELNEVLAKRPDYNALLWEKNLRETNVDVEFSGHLPSLYASLAYQYSSQSDYFKFERENNYIIAGLTLNIPIFTGWNTSAKVQKAKIEAEQSDLKLSKTENEIYIQIKNLDLKLKEAENRILSAETTFKIAKKAFDIAKISSENGLATQLELKDASVGYDQAQLNYFAAIYEYLEAYFDWELAVGIAK
ncbi:MAG: TolC family protein [Ignavibacteriales bacterium]|nr:TolC family protein [Ignavibacteriales bacterium]